MHVFVHRRPAGGVGDGTNEFIDMPHIPRVGEYVVLHRTPPYRIVRSVVSWMPPSSSCVVDLFVDEDPDASARLFGRT